MDYTSSNLYEDGLASNGSLDYRHGGDSATSGVASPARKRALDKSNSSNGNTNRAGQTDLLGHIKRGLESWKTMTKAQVLAMVCSVLMVVVGSSGQILTLNMWISHFPKNKKEDSPSSMSGGGSSWSSSLDTATTNAPPPSGGPPRIPLIDIPFTVLTLNSTTSTLCFTLVMIGWWFYRPPVVGYKFLISKTSFKYNIPLGALLCLQALCLVHATAHTPEVVQAFLISTQILWCFVFVKVIMKDPRSYKNIMVVLSFLFSLGGILLGSAAEFTDDGGKGEGDDAGESRRDQILWALIFALGMVPAAAYGAVGSFYMRAMTLEEDEVEQLRGFLQDLKESGVDTGAAIAGSPAKKSSGSGSEGNDDGLDSPSGSFAGSSPKKKVAIESELVVDLDYIRGLRNNACGGGTDETSAKLSMLVHSQLWMTFFLYCSMPLGALPWFGSSPSVGDLGEGVSNGWKCSFGILEDAEGLGTKVCSNVPVYYTLFLGAFLLCNAGIAFLNYYSPGLCAILQQVSAPFTAVLLIAAPVLNVTSQNINVGESVGAVIFITVGSLLYVAWEESTKDEVELLRQERKEERIRDASSFNSFNMDRGFDAGDSLGNLDSARSMQIMGDYN